MSDSKKKIFCVALFVLIDILLFCGWYFTQNYVRLVFFALFVVVAFCSRLIFMGLFKLFKIDTTALKRRPKVNTYSSVDKK